MSWICKWCHKFFITKLQTILESIITHIFYPKIFAVVQNSLLLLVGIVKLYVFYFSLAKMEVKTIKLKV